MAGRTRAGTAACTFHVKIFGLSDIEEVGAGGYGDAVGGIIFEDERNVELFAGFGGIDVSVMGGCGGGESSSSTLVMMCCWRLSRRLESVVYSLYVESFGL